MSFIFYKKLIKTYKVFNKNKGLNNINYISIIIIGDKNGGFGIGKSSNSNQNISIFKALSKAKSNFFKISLKNGTITHPIIGKFSRCFVKLNPSTKRILFSCGSYLRSIFDIIGIYKISSKIYGSKNFYNVLNAILNAFLNLRSFFFIKKKLNVY
ncbi:SSU ribosomal protein S5p (S2e) [Candidatus Nasuia deltocephalinicola]|uniref:Small ribosomal subunit protein uS5 n=1 Tax=Candidatus Nasuia deltocephalincola TaxID=1160784 RepID=A0A7G6UHK8_9PROT|nr:SSU ribosomal protein S5p (S2e) [Candidatus Nasuia deltocephalinicola]